jgi:hypothetical protein
MSTLSANRTITSARTRGQRGHPALARLRVLVAVAALITLAAPALARADTVTDWNLNATNALIRDAGQAPPVSVLHLAMLHGAVYDAVNAIDRRYQPYLISTRLAGPMDSKEAAAATAAYRVLVNILPAQQPTFAAQLAASLAAIPEGSSKTRGIAVGEAAAAAMIAARTDDGRFGAFRFAVAMTPGKWRPPLPPFVNDPNAWLKDVKPFLIRSASQFNSRGPYALTSRAYAREFNEVKALGSMTSTTRTPDQTNAARYWAPHPAATWSRIFRTLSSAQRLSLADNARLFAMLYLTAADALISVWDDKARWSFWRPITAIREADTDGNPATEKDGGWLPLIGNPPYPDHPSGLTALTGSIVATLQDFFRRDDVRWSDTNEAVTPPLTRSFTRLSQVSEENVNARVWSGIHFRNADEAGARIGRQVATWRERNYFQRVRR